MEFLDKLNSEVIRIWDSVARLEQSIATIVLMLLGYWFIRYIVLRRFEKLAAKTDNDLDDRLVHFLKQFLWVIALFMTVVLVLKINHVAVSPLLAGAGIFGVALGFAAKETIADILSGIFLITDRPVRVGDRVKIDSIGRHWGGWGDIVDIGIRRTQVRNTDGVIVNYPNSVFSNSVIRNFSFEDTSVRVRLRFQVPYDADIDHIRRIVLIEISRTHDIIPGTAQLVTRSLWDDTRGHLLSGILLELRYRIPDVRQRTGIRSIVLEKLLIAFRENDISLARQEIQYVTQQ
ncbi:MAG: mechanosensitive ion channel family protein [Cocleimonas sp.]|nr:mechanosensitive ion channel family protein [Cocleimonas sp.]